jgi:hypothetical protein
MFSQNIGKLDRTLRIVLGLVLLAGFFALPQASYRWVLLIGIVPLVTGLINSCALYSILGINTCKIKK